MERIAGIERGARLNEIAREHGLRFLMPGDDIAGGMSPTAELQIDATPVAAKFDRHVVIEGNVGPGQTRDRIRLLEQSWHAPEFARPILHAALFDQFAGRPGGDDGIGLEGTGTEDAYGVVMRQDQITDGFVRVLPKFHQPVARRYRRGTGFKANEKILALDRADIGITFCRQRVDAIGYYLECFLLFGKIGGRGERLGHGVLLITALDQ